MHSKGSEKFDGYQMLCTKSITNMLYNMFC